MKLLLIILITTAMSSAWADDGVDIADPVQVSALHAIQDQLDAVSTAIMGCMDSGEQHQICICKHKELVVQFNSGVKSLFSNHPSLAKLDLVRFKTPDGVWISQSLAGIQKQASADPSCDQ